MFPQELLSLCCIIFSILLLVFNKREIGLKLLKRSFHSVLKMDMTFTVLHMLGKQSAEKDLFMSSDRVAEVIFD